MGVNVEAALLPHQEDQAFRRGIELAAFMVNHAIPNHNHPHPREEVRLSPTGAVLIRILRRQPALIVRFRSLDQEGDQRRQAGKSVIAAGLVTPVGLCQG